jgi:hypothetical protein
VAVRVGVCVGEAVPVAEAVVVAVVAAVVVVVVVAPGPHDATTNAMAKRETMKRKRTLFAVKITLQSLNHNS